MTATDLELLRQFARDHSQDAFTTLVNRQVNLVYSAALRQIRSPQLAEEITQSTFTDLARNADKLVATGGSPVLTAWLYQVARRTAIDVIRRESRRQLREQIAVEMNAMNATANEWTQIEPLLDDAMAALDETDRTAILLRYFENKNLREVGETLGTNEDAAQKRVSRAVERLRDFFSKRNVTIGASGLAVLISANAVQSAPLGLAMKISAAMITTTKTLGMTMIHKFLITGMTAVAVGIGIYAFHLQSQIGLLQQQQTALVAQVEQLSRERDEAKSQLLAMQQGNDQAHNDKTELLKLRGEVGVLRRQLAEKNRAARDASSSMFDSRTNSVTPQVHIKARFIAIPSGGEAYPFTMNMVSMKTSGKGDFSGILNNENVSNILQKLSAFDGVETLAEPEVVTASGRQTQMRATRIINVMTNFTLLESNNAANITPQTEGVETGSILDVIPQVLADGYTIQLPVIASVTDFVGYAPSANTTPAYTSNGQEVDVPTVSPQFRVQQATNSVNLLDNQTLMLMLNNDPIPAGNTFLEPDGSKSKYQDRKTLVLITATLVDAAGYRVHTDADTLTNAPASTNGQ